MKTQDFLTKAEEQNLKTKGFTMYYVIQDTHIGLIQWAGIAESESDALQKLAADIGQDLSEIDNNDLKVTEIPQSLYKEMGGDDIDGQDQRAINLLEEYKQQ